MAKYRQRPIEVDAIQWTGDNTDEVLAFLSELPCPPSHTVSWGDDPGDWWITVDTPVGEGEMRRGDWLILRAADGLSVVKGSAFMKAYAPAPTATITVEPDPPHVAEAIREVRRRG